MKGKIRVLSLVVAIFIAISLFGTLCVSAVAPTYNATKIYKSGKYYRNLRAVELCGDGAQDTLAIALSQLGYHEGNDDTGLDGLSVDGNRDFVEYNVLYGKLDNNQGNGLSYGYYWCAAFVNWCLRQAEVSKEASAAAEVSCRRWLSSCIEAGIYNEKDGYTPKSADLIFFKDLGSLVSSTHIGLVLYSDGENVYTIEGNTSNGSEFSSDGNYVALKSYPLTSSYIVGYATPKYNTVDDIERVDYSGNSFSAGKYITTDEIYVYSDDAFSKKIGKIEPFTVFSVEMTDGDVLYLKGGCVKTESVVQISTETDIISLSYVNTSGKRLCSTQFSSIGETVTLTDYIPARAGAEFLGWLIAGQDNLLSPSDTLTIDESIELVAIYTDTKISTESDEQTEFVSLEIIEDVTEHITDAVTEKAEEITTEVKQGDSFENLGEIEDEDDGQTEKNEPGFLKEYGGEIIALAILLALIFAVVIMIGRSDGNKTKKGKKGSRLHKSGKKSSKSKKSKKRKKDKK